MGEKSVEKVLDYFGIRILEILREERPEEIKDVPGLRKSVKDELFNTLLGEGILSDLNHFLKVTHISSKWSRTVYTYYGVQSVAVIEDNPYTLLRETRYAFGTKQIHWRNILGITGVTRRLEAGLEWILRSLDNHITCLPVDPTYWSV